MIGHTNTALKRIGVSKLRLMAGGSANCVVCGKKLRSAAGDKNHKCVEHADWELVVVDSSDDARNAAAMAYIDGHENDSEAV